MLKNECSCMFSKMFSWRQFTFLFDSYSNGGMETWTTGSKRSQTHLKWTWNESGHELLTLTNSIKIERCLKNGNRIWTTKGKKSQAHT